MGDHKMEGKYWIKICIALLAKINFQDQWGKTCGSNNQEKGREGERERREKIWEILIQPTVQGKISPQWRCKCFRWISDFREGTAFLSNIFNSLLETLMKCGHKIHCLPLEDSG